MRTMIPYVLKGYGTNLFKEEVNQRYTIQGSKHKIIPQTVALQLRPDIRFSLWLQLLSVKHLWLKIISLARSLLTK